MSTKKRFKNRSRRAAMRIKPSHHSSAFIKNVNQATESVDSVANLMRAVKSLLQATKGVGIELSLIASVIALLIIACCKA